MNFIKHLQSSLILGTKMTHPDEEHFYRINCQGLFDFIRNQNISKLEDTIKLGTDCDRCEYEHLHPLSFAIKQNDINSINVLLSYGCNINQKDIFNKTPLDYADESKNLQIINLLQHFTDIKICENMQEAAIVGDLKALVYFHNQEHEIHQLTDEKTSLLHLCIEGNNTYSLVYLLNKGINIDSIDKSKTTALILSAMDKNKFDLLKILVDRNATLNQKNIRHISALSMAIKRDNIKAALYLVQNGADVNIRDGVETPLSLTHKAIQKASNTDLKKELRSLETLLLTKNADVNHCDDKLMWSPVMLTASHYQDQTNIDHLKSLVKLGADLNQVDKNNRTALMIATSLGRVEAIEILLRYGADLNRYDKFGWTALMLAVYYNQKKALKILLDNGVDVNFTSKKGMSALKVAIDNDRYSLVSILKEYGAVSPKE